MRPIRIRKGKLSWCDQHAKVGDTIRVYPILGGVPYLAKVEKVTRNKFGRISYIAGGKTIMTEELVKEQHARVRR